MRHLTFVWVILSCATAVWATMPPSRSDAAVPRDEKSLAADAAAYARKQMFAGGAPGFAIGIVRGPKLLFAKGYGHAGDNGREVTIDTPFILGSTTKSFTALCVMQLADAGKIGLDELVKRYLPGFMGDGPAITVRMLLNQTSGISHAAGDQPILSAGLTRGDAIRSWAMALTPFAQDRPAGASFEYSNANYIVLGAVIESVSGEGYAHYVRTHVFEPLGMNHSYASLVEARQHDVAQGYREWFGWFEANDLPYPPSFIPAGFMISSVGDMARYMAMEANGGELDGVRVISETGLTEMHRGVASMDPEGKSSYAMGWVADTFNGVPVFYHDGDTGRFTSIIAISRTERFGVVILANASGWLYGPHQTDAANGAINILVGGTTKSYATPYLITKVALGVIIVIALLQLLSVIRAMTGKPGRSVLLEFIIPTTINVACAVVFAYALPRIFFGIPLTEMVSSIPEIGVAALASIACAATWGLLTARRLIWQPTFAVTGNRASSI